MDSYNQGFVPGQEYGQAAPPPYRPYDPSQTSSQYQALPPQHSGHSHRSSQSYQAYQPNDIKNNVQDEQYQQFLQWQQFMQFQKTQTQQQPAIPTQPVQSLSPPPLTTSEKRQSRIGWQNPYLTTSDIYVSGQVAGSQTYGPQSPVSPQTASSAPSPFPASQQYFPPPPPSPAPYHTSYEHSAQSHVQPIHQLPPPQDDAVYELPSPSPPIAKPQLPAQDQISANIGNAPAPEKFAATQLPALYDYPAPLFSPSPSLAPQPMIPHYPTPASSAPQSPELQPTANSTQPRTQSLSELRERLEAAGVPDETIAAVLLQHTNLTTSSAATPPVPNPVPPQSMKAESGYSNTAETTEAPPRLPPRLPPRPSLPTTTSSSTSMPTTSALDKVVYNFCLAGTTKNSIHPVFRHHIEPANGDSSLRSYITAFTLDTMQGKEPNLRIYRKEINNPAPPQIATCLYYRSDWSQKVQIASIWRAGNDKWEPELEPWRSETGTAAGQALQWQYDAARGGESLDKFVIRCATTIPKTRKSSSDSNVVYIQGGAQSAGIPVEVEVCRIVIQDGDHARIEIPRFLLSDEKAAEQTEEMICNAIVQIFRKRSGWTTKRAMRTMNKVDSSHVNMALKTTNNALKVAGFFMKN